MITKLIGVKDFRQNLARYSRRQGLRYIIMSRNQPILEVKPLSKKEAVLAKLEADIAEARADVKAGRVFTLEEVEKKLGLK
ncbi:MAG: hypothetical protein HY983_02890 [Candidatus Magasanikbacteria bacterium]|nr:hypothetical protein [Candidatus Magasanikbacteria bacterium]